MAIGNFFIGRLIGKNVFATIDWTYTGFHVNNFPYKDKAFWKDEHDNWFPKPTEIHISGKCPVCGNNLHIHTTNIEWDGLESLVYEGVDHSCKACREFASSWDPFKIAVLMEEWTPGDMFPWVTIENYPHTEDVYGYEIGEDKLLHRVK